MVTSLPLGCWIQLIQLIKIMDFEMSKDNNGRFRAKFKPGFELLASFLDNEISLGGLADETVGNLLSNIKINDLEKKQFNGNSHTLEISAEEIVISHDYDEFSDLEIPTQEFELVLSKWEKLMRCKI